MEKECRDCVARDGRETNATLHAIGADERAMTPSDGELVGADVGMLTKDELESGDGGGFDGGCCRHRRSSLDQNLRQWVKTRCVTNQTQTTLFELQPARSVDAIDLVHCTSVEHSDGNILSFRSQLTLTQRLLQRLPPDRASNTRSRTFHAHRKLLVNTSYQHGSPRRPFGIADLLKGALVRDFSSAQTDFSNAFTRWYLFLLLSH